MKLFSDFAIVALFVLTYHFYGMYAAVAVTMVSYPLQFVISWFVTKTLDKTQLFTVLTVLILGGATLAFQNDTFFKWKPTIIYWLFASVLLTTQLFGKKVLIERLLGNSLSLSAYWWRNLNFSWVFFFFLLGMVNLFVVYYCSTTTWVYFKLFGLLGLTALFILAQVLYLSWRGAIVHNN